MFFIIYALKPCLCIIVLYTGIWLWLVLLCEDMAMLPWRLFLDETGWVFHKPSWPLCSAHILWTHTRGQKHLGAVITNTSTPGADQMIYTWIRKLSSLKQTCVSSSTAYILSILLVDRMNLLSLTGFAYILKMKQHNCLNIHNVTQHSAASELPC